MVELNFQPIFDYFDDFKFEVNRRFDRMEQRLDHVETAVSNLTHEFHWFRQEQTVANHRLDRLEAWAKPVGDKLNLPINF